MTFFEFLWKSALANLMITLTLIIPLVLGGPKLFRWYMKRKMLGILKGEAKGILIQPDSTVPGHPPTRDKCGVCDHYHVLPCEDGLERGEEVCGCPVSMPKDQSDSEDGPSQEIFP